MLLFKKTVHLQEYLSLKKKEGDSIGFVPTMGALHQGHLSLIEKSLLQSDCTVCSIFVNPTQFNEASDLEKYPRTPEQDIELLTGAGCPILFMPEVEEIYPEQRSTRSKYDFGYLDQTMEGAHRPGHFDGVAQVVSILLDIVRPDYLFLGQKDFQQFRVIQQLLDQMNADVEAVMCPIVREADGLAMSSRNKLLTPEQRRTAPLIYRTLLTAKEKVHSTFPETIRKEALESLSGHGIKPEYFEIVDGQTLRPVRLMEETDYAVACTAVRLGNIRLIDNIILKNP